ncbi:phosphoribosylanthranilate isomerase [Parafilimonas terrae]|uniref:N-(5'-phosphoribosyl)anthranilate isomerase n=1 Tax=Parafilimonas terrae TaxID=1465490 RepID=A0A1I5XBR7_9BACT|nr:phosphoribosylanthranilate isomerase [Parafilimonas terrae]SFQ29418.1 phosphoribosylanthranilate isomerase [Parafilimonas terrae]
MTELNNQAAGSIKQRNHFRIKVCGLTNTKQVSQLNELGVEFAGFNFYRPSPRYVYKSMPSAAIKKIRGKINKVGIFVDEDVDEVLRTVDDCGLYLVQLHGNESPRYCEKISNYITVIKAFRLSNDDNVEWKIKDYYEAADMFLFDTETPSFGGSGKKFNWQILKGLNIQKPFFLAGGISPDDADEIKKFTAHTAAKDLFAIDINSKFELMPGVKDIELIKAFKKRLEEPLPPGLPEENT